MSSFRYILVLSLAFPAVLSAQWLARVPTAGVDRHDVTPISSQAASVVRQAAGTLPARALPTSPADSVRRRKIGRYTLRGLGTGAAIGIVGGLIGSRYLHCGCSDTKKALGSAFWFGGIGASAGGVVGALVGGIADLRAR